MDKKIIKTGLSCRVNAKVMLMRNFLENEQEDRIVIDKLKQLRYGRTPVPEEVQKRLANEFGLQINSVTRLDDEGMREAYDGLEQDGVIRQWLSGQVPDMQRRAKKVLSWDQEEVNIDLTGFLVYAVVENDRCRWKLLEYMESQGEASYLAFQESALRDSPLLAWFPQQKLLAAMLCIGLLERIRAENENGAEYEAFLTIVSSGYKWLRKKVRQSEELAGKDFCRILMEAKADGDVMYCLGTGVIGLVMAEDVNVPVRMDFLMLSFLPILQEGSQSFLNAPEPTEICEEGRSRCREIMKTYRCSENNWIAGHIFREAIDFAELCSVFGMNLRKLRGITMTEQEMQQVFSMCPDIGEETVMPALLMAVLCKYVGQLEERYCPEEELKQLGKPGEETANRETDYGRLLEVKQELERLRRKEQQLRQERDMLAARAGELEQAVLRRREQLDQLKARQEQARREIEELQNFVCYLTEHAGEKDGEEKDAGRRCREKLDLERRRVIVIGGHENWQRRFREQFPMWQFLSADKNNFDAGCVRNKEIIIVNTSVLKHSCYYRIMAERGEEQTVLYVHGNNLERCLDELERQMEAEQGPGMPKQQTGSPTDASLSH